MVHLRHNQRPLLTRRSGNLLMSRSILFPDQLRLFLAHIRIFLYRRHLLAGRRRLFLHRLAKRRLSWRFFLALRRSASTFSELTTIFNGSAATFPCTAPTLSNLGWIDTNFSWLGATFPGSAPTLTFTDLLPTFLDLHKVAYRKRFIRPYVIDFCFLFLGIF